MQLCTCSITFCSSRTCALHLPSLVFKLPIQKLIYNKKLKLGTYVYVIKLSIVVSTYHQIFSCYSKPKHASSFPLLKSCDILILFMWIGITCQARKSLKIRTYVSLFLQESWLLVSSCMLCQAYWVRIRNVTLKWRYHRGG